MHERRAIGGTGGRDVSFFSPLSMRPPPMGFLGSIPHTDTLASFPVSNTTAPVGSWCHLGAWSARCSSAHAAVDIHAPPCALQLG